MVNAIKTGNKNRLSPARLRWSLLILLLIIFIPLLILVLQTQQQMKWEAFYQHRLLAEELAQSIDATLQQAIASEEAYGYADYQFFIPAANPKVTQPASLIQQSSLAKFPVSSALPGLIGYFQINEQGVFTTPLLPNSTDLAGLNITVNNLRERQDLRDKLLNILSENQLVKRSRLQEGSQPADFISHGALPSGRSETRGQQEDAGSPAIALTKPAPPVSASGTEAQTTAPYSQQGFDQLSQRSNVAARASAPTTQQATSRAAERPRIEDLKLNKEAFAKSKQADDAQLAELQQSRSNERSARKEQTTTFTPVVEQETAEQDASPPAAVGSAMAPTSPGVKVRIFESELDPFALALLNSGEFVLFRNVWRDSKRLIQGAIIDPRGLLDGTARRLFQSSTLARMSDMVVAWQGTVLASVPGVSNQRYAASGTRTSAALNSTLHRPAEALSGTLLHQTRLSEPLGELELLWTINSLPAGPGARVVIWSSLTLLAVLLAGFTMIYLLGMKQIRLQRQQQDFVAAVSHELKTPLTSIRMYGEMLREGWVAEEKKREYYAFIHDESERLSRLITNVLQLARMERHDIQLTIKRVQCGHLIGLIRSKIHTQTDKAGFQCQYYLAPGSEAQSVDVDIDAFSQIIINVIDNTLKFAAKSTKKRIDISVHPGLGATLVFAVRDYGPGIPTAQLKKIFDLFYRPGNELTRDTIGTGIGLALVKQLAEAMGGKAEVANKSPGAEFLLILPNPEQ